MTKQLSVNQARKIGQDCNNSHIVVFQFYPDGKVGFTSWGKTKHQCSQAKQWGEKRFNELTAGAIRAPSDEVIVERCKVTEDLFA